MLSKEFIKYRTSAHVEQYKEPFKQEFSDKHYLIFIRKFRGSMISRGKSSLSYRFSDKIWFLFKKYMKEQEHTQDIELAFKQAIFNLIPIISTSNIKKGRRVQALPVLLKYKRRMVLINKWLISSQKNKSNIRGIKIEDVAKTIFLALMKKGSAYIQKMENQKKSYNARYVLLRPSYQMKVNVGFNNLQRYVLDKLRKKYKEKEVKITDVDNLVKYISIFKFLKSKLKRKFKNKARKKFLKYSKKHLRIALFNAWDSTTEYKFYALLNWLNGYGLKKNLNLDRELLDEFIAKYNRQWRKKI